MKSTTYSNTIDFMLDAEDASIDTKTYFEITVYPDERSIEEHGGSPTCDELTDLQVMWRDMDIKPQLSELELAQVTKACYDDFELNAGHGK